MTGKKRQCSPLKEVGLEHLMQQKTVVLANIIRIKDSISERTISFEPYALECRLSILNSYIEKAMSLQSEIESIEPNDNTRKELEDTCVSSKSLLLSVLNKKKRTSLAETSMLIPNHHSRLPSMRLPRFSGSYAEFKNFFSLFENLVHNDPTLTDIEKFNHLISCLSDEALGTVKAFQITESNYPKALASLQRVYDNTCLIFFENISNLFELKPMHNPTASGLRSLIDSVSALYDSLLSIGDDKCITNAILIHLVMTKVDPTTKSKWEEQLDYTKLPTWKECETALNKRFQHMSADETSSNRQRKFKQKNDGNSKRNHKLNYSFSKSTPPSSNCFLCKSSEHFIGLCPAFSSMSVNERFNFAKNDSLCINCLRKGHSVSKCQAKRCGVCNRPHHSMLHKYTSNSGSSSVNPPLSDQLQNSNVMLNQPSTSRASVNYNSGNDDQTILATALVQVKSSSGEFLLARVLLDSCSQVNLVTEDLAQKLGLKRCNDNLKLVGVGGKNTTTKQKVTACVRSIINSFEFTLEYRILKSISSNHPETGLSFENFNIPSNIKLADPYFFKSQRVDMLIGVEIFYDLLCVGQIKVNRSSPILQKTLLGWIVAGKYKSLNLLDSKVCNISTVSEGSLSELVQRFWELEQIPREVTTPIFTVEQQMCEDKFVGSTKRLNSGRFSVSLPFKTNSTALGLSFETAKRRFLSLERRLLRNDDLRVMYMDFMKEYLNLGHMSKIKSDVPKFPHYFIPHQCVLRPQSTSTKLRVVFDASSKTSTGVSLNDILMVGPTIQDDLYSILLRFRLNRFAITADITKMYRQIEVDEEDRRFQLILWREKLEDPISIYQLNTVTYGTGPAPFLAIRCLFQLSDLHSETYPVGSSVIRRDFYVDDLLTGADDFKSLEDIRYQVQHILQTAGFKLAKWFSNHPTYDNNDLGEKAIQFNEGDTTKTLGIHWIPKDDIFKFIIKENFDDIPATKRNILSVSARLFDPLGLLCPIVTRAKILLQELWLNKIDWDESIPQSLYSSWSDFKESLCQLQTLSVPRYVRTRPQVKIQIHGFADASQRAYGCCLYIRSHENGKIHNELLTAKSKVAPLKKLSLPRLELCAAHSLSKLWSRIKSMLICEVESVTFWSDSEITLYWVKTHPSKLDTFVSNRVADIQSNTTDVVWRHVPSKLNPADIVSRGCDVSELKNSIWFNGPPFLLLGMVEWPQNPHFQVVQDTNSLEVRHVVTLYANKKIEAFDVIEKHSNYQKILRIFVYIYRFINGARRKQSKIFSLVPTAKELKFSFLKIVELIQQCEFEDEIRKLEKKEKLPFAFQKLNPFINEVNGEIHKLKLLRVGGRLLNAPISYDAKFPLLLPKQSHFVSLYLTHLHFANCHAGPKALLSLSRQQTWIFRARDACAKVVRQCIHCFRYRPKLLTQIMGNLPADRLRSMQPFLICGVDFCGPVHITLKIRGRPPVKMYIAIFVCFTSKAVHIELVSDLSTNAFISCFKRFIARRGRPKRIYSDNATNFVGASRQLQDLHEAYMKQLDKIQLFVAQEGIEFVFIPPRAPHFGGLWEAAVKSAKHLMIRTIGNALLTIEEMNTLLTEVEAILNSRPLVPMSSDPNDGEVITPGHLLIGAPLTSLPPEYEIDESSCKMHCSKAWRQLCTLKRMFWKAWSKEYLHELQQRNKWVNVQPDLAVGRLVLIHEDNCPPQQWILGRVQEIITSQDGRVRVVAVKTKKGVFRRHIAKLALLPVD